MLTLQKFPILEEQFCVWGPYVFVKPKSAFLSETLGVGFRHGYWAHQLVLVGLIAARPKLLLIVW